MAESPRVTGTIFDVKRFAVHDGPGIRTVVFLKGCPLRCVWCHNPEGESPDPELVYYAQRCIGCGECARACPRAALELGPAGEHIYHRDRCIQCAACVRVCYANAIEVLGRQVTLDEIMAEVRKDATFYEHSGGGVTLSGGEPLLQPSFARAVLGQCRREGFHTALDTCGHASWAALRGLLPHVDLVLYDLKHTVSSLHRQYTGAPIERITRNLHRLAELKVPVEVRIPVLPTVNDAPAVADGFAALLAPLGNVTAVRLLAYHRLAGSKYDRLGRANSMPEVPAPSREQLARMAERIARTGLNVVIPSEGR